MKPSLSEKLYEQACQVLPGGVSRNTVFRTHRTMMCFFRGEPPYPFALNFRFSISFQT